MKPKQYRVLLSCVDGNTQVLTAGQAVELPSDAVTEEMLQLYLKTGAVVEAEEEPSKPQLLAAPSKPPTQV